ncbi:enoyl-CoA hydratase/carnithine racemase [Daldinia caldariorum]|uniref:enoyl-CoA hydratase/carnithine racemase n=1 Tax=Daldinia caldariorum TaxID=326644 RepID=UPI002007ED0B|nr:enoyl-CoA hydratase/carnithine racemase [Daldinia caldariorum]KAI1470509.1 enoyl-CoA hydratase/carnithine racemase [Daldinia caldariorum]
MSSQPSSPITTPPPTVPDTIISFPQPHVLLVTLNRPKQLNAIPRPQHFALERLWDWYDAEPALRCAVITGSGRAFCAGADLKEWDTLNSSSSSPDSPENAKASSAEEESSHQQQQPQTKRFPPGGFGGMSNRGGLKPIVAAVNGICFGGGMEMAINCDLVVAAGSASFSLPEVTIGVIALAGALPRLVRSVGRQRAAEMALSGKRYGAREMLAWGLVNEVVEGGKDDKDDDGGGGSKAVLEKALEWAQRIAGNSPDAVIVSREGLKLGWESVGPEQGTAILLKGWFARIEKGENAVEGVKSFVERRKPVWKNSKL